MAERAREILSGDSELPTPEEALSLAFEALSSVEIATDTIFQGESPFDQLRSYGRWLHQTHGVRQFLLCASMKRIKMVRKTMGKIY